MPHARTPATTKPTDKPATSKVVKPATTLTPPIPPEVAPVSVAANAKGKRVSAKKTPQAATVAVVDKNSKPKKPKLVRDSFTFPKDEYAAIDALKLRAVQLAQPAKKSELLRAGLKLLTTLDDKALLSALQAIPAIKTGRPKADSKSSRP